MARTKSSTRLHVLMSVARLFKFDWSGFDIGSSVRPAFQHEIGFDLNVDIIIDKAMMLSNTFILLMLILSTWQSNA